MTSARMWLTPRLKWEGRYADPARVRRVLAASTIALVLVAAVLLIAVSIAERGNVDDEVLWLLAGLVLGFSAWYLASHIEVIPRVTAFMKLGGVLIALSQVLNLTEEIEALSSVPIFGNQGWLYHSATDGALVVSGFCILVAACYFAILEASRIRIELIADRASLAKSLKEQERLNRRLNCITAGLGTVTGEAFFDKLAGIVASTLEVPYVFIGEHTGTTGSAIRPLAFWNRDRLATGSEMAFDAIFDPRFERASLRFYEKGIRKRFPADEDLAALGAESFLSVPLRGSTGEVTGQIALLDVRPMTGEILEQPHLSLFAARAAVELERLRAQRSLAESERRYRLVAENVADVIWTTGTDLRPNYVNPSITQLTGFTPDEAVQLASEQEFTADSLARLKIAFKRAIAWKRAHPGEAVPPVTLELEHCCKDGSTVVGENCLSFVSDNGKLSIVGVTRNVSARKRTEETLRAASRMEAAATLASGVAHDINNLMSIVLGRATLVRDALDDGHPAQQDLRDVEDAAEKAGDLASQLLAYARGGRYQPEVLNLNDTVADVVRLEQRSAPADVQLVIDLDPDLQNVYVDRAQFEQVIMNLTINAVESVEGPGHVIVKTQNVPPDDAPARGSGNSPECPQILLTVTDTGCGIEPGQLARIFEPFHTSKATGRGLGLAAAHGIVKNHRGHIDVESQPGVGTAFKVYLPATDRELVEDSDPWVPIERANETVLVVDDERRLLNIARCALERVGYTVLTAANGQEALDLCHEHPDTIHAILLDMVMPVMGGAEAFPRLRSARPDANVIICTGYGLEAGGERFIQQGAHGILRKPYRVPALYKKIREALNQNAAPAS